MYRRCTLESETHTSIEVDTIDSKINGIPPKGVYLPIPKLHSILAVANLLAHYNLWLCYYG